MKISKLISVLLLSNVLLISACGGGGDSTSPTGTGGATELTGRFIDSAVSGLRFKTSSGLTGLTDSNGGYKYITGDTVKFYVGNLLLGSAQASGIMTPISLVSTAKDENDPLVINIARFLQSLDDDQIPGNGIVITSTIADETTKAITAGNTLSFDSSAQAVFESKATALIELLRTATFGDTKTLVTITVAQAHLKTTLLQTRAGYYAGVYQEVGQPDGKWAIEIKVDGSVVGCLDSMQSLAITGMVGTNGVADIIAGGVTTGATFTGTYSLSGSVSGTWVNNSAAANGTYSGNKTSTAPLCNIGGGAGSMNYGSLAINGNDVQYIGTTFSPNQSQLGISWAYLPPSETLFTQSLTISAIGTTASRVAFITKSGINNYSYSCYSDCAGVTQDIINKVTTFKDVVLVQSNGSSDLGTAPITLNGTLSY